MALGSTLRAALCRTRVTRYAGEMIANATSGVVELRRYAMQPGKRDDLIALFEQRFIETQEACGMVPIGHYRDRGDADSFVWFRTFASMETRSEALNRFYTSPIWVDNRVAANATMADSDNVLLLRSARADSGFDTTGLTRPSEAGTPAGSNSLVAVSIFMLDGSADEDLLSAFESTMLPELRRCANRVAYFVTEERPNDVPRLPVREDVRALVVTGVCADEAAFSDWSRGVEARTGSGAWSHVVSCETLQLQPARRSLFR